MKQLLLALVLATVTACAGGVDTTEVRCPDKDQQMSREEWKACYGYQDHDASGSEDR